MDCFCYLCHCNPALPITPQTDLWLDPDDDNNDDDDEDNDDDNNDDDNDWDPSTVLADRPMTGMEARTAL